MPCFHVRGDTRHVCEKTISIVDIAEVCKSTVSKILKEDTHTAVLVAVWMVVVIVFGVATRGTFSIASTVEWVLNEYVSQKIELLASLRYMRWNL